MKVLRESVTQQSRSAQRAIVILMAAALVAVVGFTPAPAHAITRAQILARAHSWVAKRIMYSQSKYYRGYRRDCSGFVSMAWRTRRNYTSRTIHRVARRVPLSRLRPGDAIRTPGHVAIFVRWKNKRARTFVAMEEYTWGRPAAHRVKRIRRGAVGLRYDRVKERTRVAAAPKPIAPEPAAPVVAGTGVIDTGAAATVAE